MVFLISVSPRSRQDDFGLSEAQGFDQTGQYPGLMTGPSGDAFNHAGGVRWAIDLGAEGYHGIGSART
ncbi:MAG: hypothetical protein R3C09_13335 [Pirellulaceae bacterium]